jgi:ribosome-binding factor A
MKRTEDGAGGHRHARLQDILLEELILLFADDIEDPSLQGVAVVAVVLSVDYRHLRIHVVPPPIADSALAAGARAARAAAYRRVTPFLRRHFADVLDLRIVPEPRFIEEASA